MRNPKDVVSPKTKLTGPIEVVAEHRKESEFAGSYSVARFKWERVPSVGIRWDGDPEDEKDVGNPQSRGLPTWFVLPAELAAVIVEYLETNPAPATVVAEPARKEESMAVEDLDARIEAVVERMLLRHLKGPEEE